MFPSAKATEEGRMDEERRLFYVAVTRAKDKLYMFTPQMRKTPDGGIFPVEMSQFLKEVPHDLVQMRIVQSYPDAYASPRPRYGGGYGGYGSGGYGGRSSGYGYGGGGRGGSKPPPVYKTTWRR